MPSTQTTFKKHLKLSVSLLALPTCGVFAAMPAHAQSSSTDEIIVTATRRAESIQDIPLNIAAVGGAQIEEQGFGDISELMSYVPGINIVDQGGRDGNRIVVRGLNADPISGGGGGAGGPAGGNDGGGLVATYLGEIPLYVDLRLNDLERVEVLLGPQGTLYGAGTMGGAIRYIPVKPKFGTEEFSARAEAFSYKEGSGISTDTGFTANIPLGDKFALRGSFDYLNDEGFIDYPFVVRSPGGSNPDPNFSNSADVNANLQNIKDANWERTLSGRIAARWEPIDEIDATLTYYYQDRQNGGRTTSGLRGPVPAGEYEAPLRVEEPGDYETQLLALEIVADLGFAELTSATGLSKETFQGQRDQTDLLISLEYSYETFPTFTGLTFEDEKSEAINQELRLVSTSDSRFNWIIGGFYNKADFIGLSSEFTPGFGDFAFGPGTSALLNDLEYFAVSKAELQEYAAFGEIGFEITDAWQITVGGRYYEYNFQDVSSISFPYFEDASFSPVSRSEAEDQFEVAPNQKRDGELFKVNTSYKFGGGNTVYATFSQGYRVGGSNGLDACPDVFVPGPQGQCGLLPGQQFGPNPGDVAQINEQAFFPDTVDNYEIGAKTTWLDGALTLNGALFFIKWDAPQVASASVNANIPITVNAGAAETRGVELAGNWQVTDNFDLRGNFSYTESELTEDVPSLIRTIAPGGGFTTAFEDGQEGDRLPGSPKSQFSVFGSYKHPLENGADIHMNAGYSWQGSVLSRTGGRGSSLTLPSFGRADASIGYATDAWSLTAFAENVFNDYSESSVVGTVLSNQAPSGLTVRSHRTNVLPPRVIGARMNINFK